VPWTGGGQIQLYFGANGDVPVMADYDGDGTADLVYFRPATGTFFGRLTNGGLLNVQRGVNGDIPVSKRTAP